MPIPVHMPRTILACLCGLLALPLLPMPARAAESYDACAGFIDSVPATITTQGVWCQRKDLATAIANGAAITIATNNVTIDCNGFKLGGLAAGNGSNAYGILASNRQNATVRNCNVRGFHSGIALTGGGGHLVEDNRLDNNLSLGIAVEGDNNLVQRNRVHDTGGWSGGTWAIGIQAHADLIGNTVSGLFVDAERGLLYGILPQGTGTQVRDNIVSGFSLSAAQGGDVDGVVGIALGGPRQRVAGNHVVGSGSHVNGAGIHSNTTSNYCMGNTVSGFATNISATCTSSGNLTSP